MQLPPQWRWKLDRLKESLSRTFSSREDARPRICPACGTLVGIGSSKCHECGTNINFSMAAMGRSIAEALPQESPATYFLMGICFLLFMVSMAATVQLTGQFSIFGGIRGDVLYRLGGRVTPMIVYGEVWRLVMPIFLHGGLMHIGMNMFVLKDLGPQLEELYGSARYLFLFLLTGILGFVCTTIWDLMRHNYYGISIGASGSLMGLLGLAIAVTTVRGGAYMQMIRAQLIRSFLFILVIGLIIPGIDNAAHIGGFASGFLLGRIFEPREPANAAERKRAYRLGWFAAIIIIASFAATIYTFFTTAPPQ